MTVLSLLMLFCLKRPPVSLSPRFSGVTVKHLFLCIEVISHPIIREVSSPLLTRGFRDVTRRRAAMLACSGVVHRKFMCNQYGPPGARTTPARTRYTTRPLTDKQDDGGVVMQFGGEPLRQDVDRPRLPGEILRSIFCHPPFIYHTCLSPAPWGLQRVRS